MLAPPPAPELCVVTRRDEEQVERQQRRDQDRQQEHVRDVHPRLERRHARERRAPDQLGEVRPDEREGHGHRVPDREAHPRQQVVDQRVAEVALEQRQQQHRDAEVVRQVARLSEGAGEEDPQQVERDRGDEHVGGPVVSLPHQQPRFDLEGQVDRRAVGVRHLHAAQRQVLAVVDGGRSARLEEERQIDPGADQDDERVQGDLAEQERPVVGKDVAQRLPQERGRTRAVVEEADGATDHVDGLALRLRTPHQEGPTGPENVPAARRWPARST